MYEMEGPQHDLAAASRRSLGTARCAGPTAYLEDLVVFPGCPELTVAIRFAPVTRPDPNLVTATDRSAVMPPESLPDLLRGLPRIRFPASAVT